MIIHGRSNGWMGWIRGLQPLQHPAQSGSLDGRAAGVPRTFSRTFCPTRDQWPILIKPSTSSGLLQPVVDKKFYHKREQWLISVLRQFSFLASGVCGASRQGWVPKTTGLSMAMVECPHVHIEASTLTRRLLGSTFEEKVLAMSCLSCFIPRRQRHRGLHWVVLESPGYDFGRSWWSFGEFALKQNEFTLSKRAYIHTDRHYITSHNITQHHITSHNIT